MKEYKVDVTMTKRGRLIAFEGIDGAGKKTLTRFLKKQLTQQGLSVKTFRYPVLRSYSAGKGRWVSRAARSSPWYGK